MHQTVRSVCLHAYMGENKHLKFITTEVVEQSTEVIEQSTEIVEQSTEVIEQSTEVVEQSTQLRIDII